MKEIKVGTMLLSEPYSWDDVFRRAVVLMTELHEGGQVGLILNRPMDMKLKELLADFPIEETPLFYGGPVNTDMLHFLHNVGDLITDSHAVMPGVWINGDFEELRFLMREGLVTNENVRFFIGTSEWEPNQLIGELNEGHWIVLDGDANFVMTKRPHSLWREVLHRQDGHLSIIGDIPDDNFWN